MKDSPVAHSELNTDLSVRTVRGPAVLGWMAVICSTLFAGFWGFWGAIENFHEGWYSTSLLQNLGLMLIQYLSPMLLFVALALASLRWPRTGGGAHILVGALLPTLLMRTTVAVTVIGVPLGLLGLLYWFGRPTPVRRAQWIVAGVPLLIAVGFAIGPAVRVAGRVDDGIRSARAIEGNGVMLVWAPEGPGWPATTHGYTWEDARDICAHLTEDGTGISDVPQNLWRLPTVDEAVRSMVRHGTNAGGSWDAATHHAAYTVTPDKETPLWDPHSPIIYWWTATTPTESTAYRAVYNGGVQLMHKKSRMGDWAFRAVKDMR